MIHLKRNLCILGGVLLGFVLWAGLSTMPRDVLERPLVLNEAVKPSDVIIVLGSGTRKTGDHMTSQGRQRVTGGILAFRRGLAPRMLMAGGFNKKTGLVEADVMSFYAAMRGMDEANIVEERESKDTWQNAVNSIAMMHDRGWKTAIVVSSPLHMWRACRMFHKLGADVRCVPRAGADLGRTVVLPAAALAPRRHRAGPVRIRACSRRRPPGLARGPCHRDRRVGRAAGIAVDFRVQRQDTVLQRQRTRHE